MEADEIELETWQVEIVREFQGEIRFHFAAEEREVFPRVARFPELRELVQELLADHAALRRLVILAEQRGMDALGVAVFADKLSSHIRKEERQLFQEMQERMSPEEMQVMGEALERALAEAVTACALPAQEPA